jgi:GTP cyclohydrolase I
VRDVQAEPETRNVEIARVGIRDFRYPVRVLDRDHGTQDTVAEFVVSTRLGSRQRGAHMSRFVESVRSAPSPLSIRACPELLRRLQESTGCDAAAVQVTFPYFMERRAPVTGALARMSYECRISSAVDGELEGYSLAVKVPVCMVCPCSKAISEYGAHGQRAYVDLEVEVPLPDHDGPSVWLEELVELVERAAPSPVYPLLKREDERHVTEQSFAHAAFVEDLCRDVVVALRTDSRVLSYRVKVTSEESIHDHAAFAEAQSP